MSNNLTTLPVFQKGSIRYAITNGKALPLVHRSRNSGPYRHSKKPLPEGLPFGHYLGKPSQVDQTELDFLGIAEFESKLGMARLASDVRKP